MSQTQPSSSSSPSSSTPATFSPRLFHGGCICGAVRYEVTIDFSAGTTRCNCSICTKLGLWNIAVKPEAFRVLQGEADLADYQRLGKFGHYWFCRHCGVHSFGTGDAPWMGGAYVSIDIKCLEELGRGELDLTGVQVRSYDGRNDDWQSPRITHLAPEPR